MGKFYYGQASNGEYGALLERLSGSKPNSEHTSTLPLAQIWKPGSQAYGMLKGWFEDKFPGIDLDSAEKVFEHATPIRGEGIGKASMTDLMLIDEKYKIAIEAKFKEVFDSYEPIGKWLEKGDRENRIKVLNGWLKDVIGDGLPGEEVKDVPYQFLHRAASALRDSNGRDASVVYVIFWNADVDAHNHNNTKRGRYSKVSKRTSFINSIKKAYKLLSEKYGAKFKLEICLIETRVAEGIHVPPPEELGSLYGLMRSESVYVFDKFPLR